MKKQVAVLIVVGGLMGLVASVYAFDLPGMGGSKSQSTESSGPDAVALQEGIVRQYNAASAELLTAQALLAKAFGSKEDAAKAEEEAKALRSGNVSDEDSIKKTVATSKEIDAKTKEWMGKNVALSDEGRKLYASAFIPYAKAVAGTNKLLPELKKFSEAATAQIKSAGLMDALKMKGKLAAGMYLASNLPGHASMLVGTSKNILTYAKSNNIPLPKDPTGELHM